MNSKGITHFLITHAGADPVSFHMPGHKGARLYRRFGYGAFLDQMADCDITEIVGADNLFQTEGIIAETMTKYRRLYHAKASYLLINGSSGGLIASIMACVPQGGKLIMARNCHKSIFNALTLGGIRPVYAYPAMVEQYGITGAVTPSEIARLLEEHPDASAVILPSPNYYGICSDIRAIADLVHKAGKFLIVDQAHGAHLKFFEDAGGAGFEDAGSAAGGADAVFGVPESAETQGADLVINSTHKTLCSFTQSAVLNVPEGSRFDDLYLLEDKLQLVESTSPSYLLMGSLDINADILADHGAELISEWRGNLEHFYQEAAAIDGLQFMRVTDGDRQAMDMTKINLDMSACGLDGHQLEAALLKYGIFAELVTGNILMCMTGIGNSRADYDRLLAALREIAGAGSQTGASDVLGAQASVPGSQPTDAAVAGAALWTQHRVLHEVPRVKELLPLTECAGRICASSLIPYPPGIPLICPGEEIGSEEIDYIRSLRRQGDNVIGVDADGRIAVGK